MVRTSTVDRSHNAPGNRLLEANPDRVEVMKQQMEQAPYLLDSVRLAIVLTTLHEVCRHRHWILRAAHVRTNHIHAIIEAAVPPEASRSLNRLKTAPPDRKRWARHGSTRWLWKDDDVQEAIRYVVYGQGDPMEVYLAEALQ